VTGTLNRCRTASQTEYDIKGIQGKSLSLSQDDYPINALHIWAENDPVNEHNLKILQELAKPLSVDQYPLEVTKQDIDKFLTKRHSETGGLDFEILIKEGTRVMLTTNIDINGQMRTTTRIHIDQITNKPVKFDDERADRITIDKSAHSYAAMNNVKPIVPVSVEIKIWPGKPSSAEIQRIQFAFTLACTVHKVQGLTLENIVVSFDLFKQRSFSYDQAYAALSRATSLSGLHILGNIQSKHIRAEIKVENGAESAKIVTNVQKFQDCALHQWMFVNVLKPRFKTSTNIPLTKGTVQKRLDICYYFGTFYTILNFYFLTVVPSATQHTKFLTTFISEQILEYTKNTRETHPLI